VEFVEIGDSRCKKKYEEIRVFAPENQSKSISVEHQKNQMLGTYFPKAHHKPVNQIEFSSLFKKEITLTNQPAPWSRKHAERFSHEAENKT
jgi:hypothetical protein